MAVDEKGRRQQVQQAAVQRHAEYLDMQLYEKELMKQAEEEFRQRERDSVLAEVERNKEQERRSNEEKLQHHRKLKQEAEDSVGGGSHAGGGG